MSEERNFSKNHRDRSSDRDYSHRDSDREGHKCSHSERDSSRSHHRSHGSHHHRSQHRSDRHRSSRDEKDRHRENRHRRRDDDGYRDRGSRERRSEKESETKRSDEYELMNDVSELKELVNVTQTQLNEMNAKILKAKLRNSNDLPRLEAEYSRMKDFFYEAHKKGKQVQLQNDSLLSKRQYGISEINSNDMTIEDMVREEKSTSGLQKSSMTIIMKDKKYSNDLDYQDDYSDKLAEYVSKGAIDLKTMETSQAKRLADKLDRCQLCIENDNCCDILSMGDKVYLTLPPEPTLVKYSTMIVPINHTQNTIQCDEDEWDEIRNYMISLSKFYYTKLNKSVIFYESSIYKYNHAAIIAVPIPMSLASTIQGFFKQAILEKSSELEQHHGAIIDTAAMAETSMGRNAFKYAIAKEAPYFHVWFNLNGGVGHIVEDVSSWPKGDLFAREIIGGVLNVDPYTIKKQGRWKKNDENITEMSTVWREFDWTEVN